jgi:hypothetical protein
MIPAKKSINRPGFDAYVEIGYSGKARRIMLNREDADLKECTCGELVGFFL